MITCDIQAYRQKEFMFALCKALQCRAVCAMHQSGLMWQHLIKLTVEGDARDDMLIKTTLSASPVHKNDMKALFTFVQNEFTGPKRQVQNILLIKK